MKYLKQSVQWHITEVCPNRCKHCYIGGISNEERRKNELSIDKLISILDNLKAFEDKYDAELKRFAVTGGDPFEYADFERFLDELSVRGKEINILGIPERVTKENLEMLSMMLYHKS